MKKFYQYRNKEERKNLEHQIFIMLYKNYYCFDGKDGKIVLYFKNEKERKDFLNTIKEDCRLNEQILTKNTKVLLNKRNSYLKSNEK